MKNAAASLTAALTLCLIGSPASAAGSSQASLSADGRMTYFAPGALHNIVPRSHAAPKGMTEIVNTFNDDPNNAYDCCQGWTLSSTGSIVGAKQSIAMPFTPAADTNLRQVVVGIGWVTGANHVTLSLSADANGVPGDSIKRAQEDDFPVFGTCCEVVSQPSKPIPLTGGMQYWLVARVTADTWAAWNVNNIGMSGPFAFNPGGGWVASEGPLGAFAVFGD
jgi:hypothetical protein